MSERWKKGLLAAGWNLRKAVELALDIEEMAAELYRELARKWEDTESLRALFAKLADDEVAHQDGFRDLLAGVELRERQGASPLDGECLKAIAHGCFFAEERGVLSGIENAAGREQVLDKVLKFENATILYYRGLKDVLGASPTLEAMIAQEKRHAIEVMRAMDGSSPSSRHGTSTAS